MRQSPTGLTVPCELWLLPGGVSKALKQAFVRPTQSRVCSSCCQGHCKVLQAGLLLCHQVYRDFYRTSFIACCQRAMTFWQPARITLVPGPHHHDVPLGGSLKCRGEGHCSSVALIPLSSPLSRIPPPLLGMGGGRWAQVPRAITHPRPNLLPAMRSVRPMKTTNITGLFGKELK